MGTNTNLQRAGGATASHKITIYKSISKPDEGEANAVSMDELYEYMDKLSKTAKSLSNLSQQQVKEEKQRNLQSCVFASLEDDYRSNQSFLGRSLLSIDIDQKNSPEKMSYQEILDSVKSSGLDAILYTTISHRSGNSCCRIIVDIGQDCDEFLFKNYTSWFKQQLDHPEIVDNASKTCTQAMILPVAYQYDKPRVDRVCGQSIVDRYPDAVEHMLQKERSKPRTKKSRSANVTSINSKRAEQKFDQHVELLHKSLIKHLNTGTSIQYFRNRNDKGAGLYCGHDNKVVHDPSRDNEYSLYFSLCAFDEALNHKLPSRADVLEQCLDWEADKTAPYAVFQENAGSGKSSTLIDLSKQSHEAQRRIFTFHTRTNRNAFFERTLDCVLVYGNVEIIENVVNDNDRWREINAFLNEHYEDIGAELKRAEKLKVSNSPTKKMISERMRKKLEHMIYLSGVLDQCVKDDLITENEKSVILDEARANKAKEGSPNHLIMTTKKLEYLVSFGDEDTFKDDIIYTDEVYQGMLTNIPSDTILRVYSGTEVELEETVSINYDRLAKLKRCLVTAEECVSRELNHHRIPYTKISEPVKTYDGNLEIAVVRSTSSKRNVANSYESIRQRIYDALRRHHGENVNIIADGLSDSGCDTNHTNTKGSNSFKGNNNIIIMSYPSPQELANAIFCTGLDERDAIKLIMSDKLNQAIGRNMGYRNKDDAGNPSKGDNHCLVILPEKQYLDMHNVTYKVTRVSHWNTTQRNKKLSEINRKKFYFRSTIEVLANTTKAKNQKSIKVTQSPASFGNHGVSTTSSHNANDQSNIIYYVFAKCADNGAKRISLKEIQEDTGISRRAVNKVCNDNFDVSKVRPWNCQNDSKTRCVKLDNRFVS